MKFSLEPVSDSLFAEVLPLVASHFKETTHLEKITRPAPDIKIYKKLDDLGMLRVYTARDGEGDLVGYATYMIKSSLHHEDSIQAASDSVYISPQNRGIGADFISWCCDRLKEDGARVIYQTIKVGHPAFAKILTNLGYSKMEEIYGREC